MDKEEQLLKEYQNNRRKLEEQEDDIKKFQRQGQQIADETYSEIRYLLSDISEDDEALNAARIELANLEEAFLMNIDKEKNIESARRGRTTLSKRTKGFKRRRVKC